MTEKAAFVYVDLDGVPCLAGRLWARWRRGRESATFAYDHDHDPTASLKLALDSARHFGLDRREAERVAGEVGMAVSRWRIEAKQMGLNAEAIGRMRSAFEHEDRDLALSLSGSQLLVITGGAGTNSGFSQRRGVRTAQAVVGQAVLD